jgi:hypothetical protein
MPSVIRKLNARIRPNLFLWLEVRLGNIKNATKVGPVRITQPTRVGWISLLIWQAGPCQLLHPRHDQAGTSS